MAENVGVSKSKLVSTSAAIREINGEMNAKLENVVLAINDLNKVWQSESSKKLQSIAANMQNRFDGLSKEAETFAVWLDTAAANYNETEDLVVDTAAKINDMFK